MQLPLNGQRAPWLQSPLQGEGGLGGGLAAGAHAATLPALPAELIDVIGCHLKLGDRMSFTSCCALLWRRTDVAASTMLWGTLHIQKQLENPALRRSLHSWLRRRRRGLQHLRLPGMLPAWLEPLFAALEGSTVQHLALSDSPMLDGLAPLGALSRLPVLQSLDLGRCRFKAVPSQLTALGSSLSSLTLSRNPLGTASEAGWQPLASLTALTALDVRRCELECLPSQLSALAALQSLMAGSNILLGKGGESAFAALGFLTRLTALGLSACSLECLPTQLSPMSSSLASLNLTGNPGLGTAASLPGLDKLTALTSLSLSHCGLTSLPQQASALQRVAELQLAGNALREEEGRPAGLHILSALSALTQLDLSSCALQRLPSSLAHLCRLRCLGLHGNSAMRHNRGAHSEMWQPLSALTALTGLDLSFCQLDRIPAPLLSLSASLVELQLTANPELVLVNFPAGLTRLDLSECHGMRQLPQQLAALAPSLRSLGLAGNKQLGRQPPDSTLAPLMHLTRLVQLDLRNCALCSLPAHLLSLKAVTDLRLSWNTGLSRESESVWRVLEGLPELERLELVRCGLHSVPGGMVARGVHVKL